MTDANFWDSDPVMPATRAPTDVSIKFRDTAAPASAAPAANEDWWSADPVAPQPSSTTGDVLKSLGSGAVKGIEALAGLPGDVQKHLGDLVGKGVLSLGDLMGLPRPPQEAIDRQPFNGYGPTSENIGKLVEKVAGPLHTPETTAGKYAETIGEFVPGAVAMGPAEGIGGVVSNATKLAAIPGAASEGLGQQFQGTWMEPIARITGALVGGGLASAGGKIGEALANRSAAVNAADTLGGDVNPAAVRHVGADFAADELTPQIVAQKQANLGPEAMMLDMGRQLRGRGAAIATQSGKGQNRILDAVEERVHGRDPFGQVNEEFGQATADRTKAMLDQTMGPTPDIVAYQKNVNDIVDQHAKPLYDQVMTAHPVVNVPAGITDRPAVAEAMKRAVGLAKNYGEKLEGPTETQTIISGPGYHIADDVTPAAQTSLRYWDYVKKAMDQRIRGIMQSGDDLSSAEKADLGGLQSARTALVSHLDNVTGGAYAVARKVAATKPEVKEAIEMGRGALNSRLLPEELADEMSGMSLPQQSAVKAGMRREVDRIIDTARNDGAAARKILDTNQNRQKIAQVFGQDAADAVDQHIAAETRFQRAAGKVAGNSDTAVRLQLGKETEGGSISQPPSATTLGILHAAARRGQEYLGNVSLDRTRQGIADLLTRRGHDIPTLARVLAGYNAQRAANAGPAIGRQAGSLASVIASQTPGWITGFLPGNSGPNQPSP